MFDDVNKLIVFIGAVIIIRFKAQAA